jgi:Glycosyl transferase family 2
VSDLFAGRFLAPAGPGQPLDRSPSFSVIVAAFQAADVIGAAIESLLAQTHMPREIVVCDDGSTDDIEGALSPYREHIVLIRQANGGEAAAKNAAARAASGDFVAILDADDAYLPGRLDALARLAAGRPDLDILTTDAYLEVDGRRIRRCYTDEWTFEVEDQRRAILERNFVFGHVAVRRERFLAAGGFDEAIRWTTDWECWIRMILDGARAGCVAEPLALYRVHEGSLSARRDRLLAGRVQTLEKTAARGDLSAAERSIVDDALGRYRSELALLELRAALREGRGDARTRALAVARSRRYPRRVRVNAVAAALLPSVAGRRERRRSAESWVGAGGTHVLRA